MATNDARFGDYQSNHAFRLGRALRTNPRAVATEVVAQLPEHPAVAKVEVAGPGFVNFHLDDGWLQQTLVARMADERLGAGAADGRTIVIDYSSPNIAKRMHVGHLRSTIIGAALDRLYRFLGWRVIADNHLGDWGTQFGKLIVAWKGWRDDAGYEADPIGELQRIYQAFPDRAEADPSLIEQARAETARLQAGDAANRALWEQFVTASLAEFDAVYERLGVRFDVTLGESAYNEALGPLVERLLAAGIAVESEGAVVVPFTADDGRGLGKNPLLIRKRDGAAMYGTTDLATVEHRMATWQPDRICYVTDTRQQQHFRHVFAASRKMGVEVDFAHAWFGMLRFADGAIAATRAGQVVNLVDVLDTAVAHARSVVDDKSGHLSESERAEIAESVGVGAVIYTDLSQNPQSDIVFDWKKMLSLEGNTAPYLMYAHARCCSVFRKADVEDFTPGGLLLEHPQEQRLARLLVRTPEIVAGAARTWRPNLLAEHLYQVAGQYARFWGDCRVLDADAPATTQSRLTLSWATRRGLAVGLGLLGLRPLERM